MLKKSFILIILMLFIITTAVYGTGNKFTDVGDYWATDAIKWAAEKGVVEGYTDGTFKPSQNVKEAEFAAILARYVDNTDKELIKEREPGKHWSQSIYDELLRWALPLKGYTDDTIKDSVITRGDVARVIAAKNGFNLTERQAVYYMYENDLSTGMFPGRLDFDSYGVDKPLQRDQITQFMKLLSEEGYTTFMGQPSAKGDAGPTEMVGIEDTQSEDVEITDEMFDELAREKGIENPKEGQSRFSFANEVAKKHNLKTDDYSEGVGLKDKLTNNTLVAYTLYDDGKSFQVLANNFNINKDIALDLIEATGKVKIEEIKENIRYHLEVNGIPEYRDITGGVTEISGSDLVGRHLTIRIYLER